MELSVMQPAFNPELLGKAVRIKGHDEEGQIIDSLFLVKNIVADKLIVTGVYVEERNFYLFEFDQEREWFLTLTVLEENLNGDK
ncbi:hypothetical protein PP175_21505 [Aneurinibacillus sp. Ricciae_BoGa-3]|uniref:hypothetical protein n=1 Tax=Aneurinibacillus sp. Ricciae_BoGa-3 TaxID=3022697 RepID=UPI00233FFAAF|nr:hypothetical protein [Aneurinibacillus sp. Ricciae_BoGa-3]WCK53869.1 hypothetical protein PP175_21505 [Aneurinibacillus sp. Ricciae_BoGa-3]